MSLTDEIIHSCPYCSHRASVKAFATWEKNGKRGLLGKTPEGFIMILCPECQKEIKYDTLGNKFLRPDEIATSTTTFNVAVVIVAVAIIYILLKFVF